MALLSILIVTGSLVGVAFEAQRLKVSQVILASVLSRNDMVHFDGSLVRRNAT